MRADTLGDRTLFFFLQTHSHHINNALFMPIYPSFYFHVLLLVSFRPDLLLLTDENILNIPELTVGFETHMQNHSDLKTTKYSGKFKNS